MGLSAIVQNYSNVSTLFKIYYSRSTNNKDVPSLLLKSYYIQELVYWGEIDLGI
jgi:hypothetical protein